MSLQLRTLVKDGNSVELSLVNVPIPDPKPHEVVVRIEAAPINPSDLGLLFGPADMSTLQLVGGTAASPVVSASIPASLMPSLKARVGQSLPAGNEGAGVVVKAGTSEAAQALLGKVVGVIGGGTYSQYKKLDAMTCLPFPDGVTPAECASWFVNPLTVLGMVETMRAEGHKALIHTAAASNLGQMLNKVCMADAVPLVNVVRRPEHAETLRSLGAKHIVNSSLPTFADDLTKAIVATGATLAFDATGGGKLAGQILTCMEAAANMSAQEYSRYGSSVHKQVYIYGGLDRSPTVLTRNFGMAWGVGGWLLTPFLQKIGLEGRLKLRQRVAAEIKTTFASAYTAEVSLAEALDVECIARYSQQATGQKYLVNPSKGVRDAVSRL
mmetsp:Transcript_33378/g.95879  ORF Transcript_33378/g.95879 Transcript_33378/m.95879 type:complete len:383 (+) Transcript_33378:58-1206(+)